MVFRDEPDLSVGDEPGGLTWLFETDRREGNGADWPWALPLLEPELFPLVVEDEGTASLGNLVKCLGGGGLEGSKAVLRVDAVVE